MNKNRVVITGIGMITPAGPNAPTTWNHLQKGRSAITHYHTTDLTLPIGQINNYEDQLTKILTPKEQTRTDRFTHFALLAGSEALHDAGLLTRDHFNRSRCGAYVGVSMGGLETIREASCSFQARGHRGVSALVIPKSLSNLAASWLAITHALRGPTLAINSACASGTDAIGLAFRAIAHGDADFMVAGGTESVIGGLGLTAFNNIRALSHWPGEPHAASRPFDNDRSGFVMSEGAGMLVLERAETAQQRGAHIYAEIIGYGMSNDAYHTTAMQPDGHGAQQAILRALNDAGVRPEQIGYINAHGTGTQMNDAIETHAIKQIFGAFSDPTLEKHLLISSTKSMLGHMLGAAGGVEAGLTALSLDQQMVLPTINRDTPDPACDLDYVAQACAQETEFDYALSQSFGFGGNNAVLCFKKWGS